MRVDLVNFRAKINLLLTAQSKEEAKDRKNETITPSAKIVEVQGE
jgi:hypothetical protein